MASIQELLLDPTLSFPWHQTRDKYPRSPCPDATNRLQWCRGNQCRLFQTVLLPRAVLQVTSEALREFSHADPQTSIGHLAAFPSLLAAPHTNHSLCSTGDGASYTLLSNPSPHKVATGSPGDEGWAAAEAVVCDLEHSWEKPSAASPSAHFSLIKRKHWRSGTILNRVYNGHHIKHHAGLALVQGQGTAAYVVISLPSHITHVWKYKQC